MNDALKNFDHASVIFHWILALSFFALFGLGWYMVTLDYYDPLYTKLPHVHRSAGMLLLLCLTLFLLWRLTHRAPGPLTTLKPWERSLSMITHWLIRVGVVIVLVSGYLISTAEGAEIHVFDWFSVPATITDITFQEDRAGLAHKYSAYFILGLTLIHALAALKHHFYDRDATLMRMLGLNKGDAQ